METLNEFDRELARNVRAKIQEWKRDGTTGASIECLRSCVATPRATDGAPRGGNLQWQYAQRFADVVKRDPIALRFILNPR